MSTMTTSDKVQIAYRVLGEGPRTILAIHGWMVSSTVYDELAERLDLTGFRLVIPDLRGSGESDRPESGYTVERYAADVTELMDVLGDRSFVLIGHSMGGAIAQWIASAAPERVQGQVLLCPVPASGIPFPPDAAALFRGADNRESKATILGMACTNLSESARERLLGAGASIPAKCIAEGFESWSSLSFADRLKHVTARTLVVATDDPFLPPPFLRQTIVDPIAGARLAVIRGAGHYVQVERPDETVAVISAFLAGLG
ncbi:Pimeloyl-ACP methyl ester carboxylesterase [Nannocystis exedens]|uniref:Pimeloyl-ACP methyl ester carboxylesterase n=1 Tax=Nannocystis exedens TaxID=54 RepID=A0A1I1XIY1_9BACT|nr:alpha/beta hydrolase [Nannocystis exedens]PCC73376.1 alpha/beta hydrolase [Nannocystis exedens]SFE07306.1 Pimeloyl-ACP methyl ester carboxylesterase [Nannocystis exedens]